MVWIQIFSYKGDRHLFLIKGDAEIACIGDMWIGVVDAVVKEGDGGVIIGPARIILICEISCFPIR